MSVFLPCRPVLLITVWLATVSAPGLCQDASTTAYVDKATVKKRLEARFTAIGAAVSPAADAEIVRLVTTYPWHAVSIAINLLYHTARTETSKADAARFLKRAKAIGQVLADRRKSPGVLRMAERVAAWSKEDLQTYRSARTAYRAGRRLKDEEKHQDAAKMFLRAARRFRAVGHTWYLAHSIRRRAICFSKLGDFVASRTLVRKVLPLWRTLGSDAMTATCLDILGIVNNHLGNNLKALDFYQQSMALRRTIGNPRDIAASLLNLGALHSSMGNYQKAISCYEEVLASPPNTIASQTVLAAMANLGMTHSHLSAYQKALEYYKKVEPLLKKVGTLADKANNLGNIANVHHHLADYDRSLAYRKRQLAILEPLERKYLLGIALNSLGKTYVCKEMLSEAMACQKRALELHEKAGTPAALATDLECIAHIHWLRCEYTEAFALLQRALALRKRTGNNLKIAGVLSRIGSVHCKTGRFDEAIRCHEKAVEIFRNAKIDHSLSCSLRELANDYRAVGQFKKAVRFHGRALELARKVGDRQTIAHILRSLGADYSILGDEKRAIECLEEALAIQEDLSAPREMAKMLHTLGNAHLEYGRDQEALSCHRRALKLHRGIDNIMGVAYSTASIGMVHIQAGRFDEAIRCYHETLKLVRGLDCVCLEAVCYCNLASAYAESGRPHKALDAIERSADHYDGLRTSVVHLGDESRQAFGGANLADVPIVATLALRCAPGSTGTGKLTSRAYAILERFAGSAMRDLVVESAVDAAKRLEPDLAASKRKLEARVAEVRLRLDRLRATKADRKSIDRLRDMQHDLDEKLSDLLRRIRLEHPSYASLFCPRALKSAEVQELLAEGEVLLAYLLAGKEVVVFVITRDSLDLVPLDKKANLQKMLAAWIDIMRLDDPSRVDVDALLARLSKILIHPLDRRLAGADSLTIIPHGTLCFLPFEALSDTGGKRIVERLPVRYVHSGTVLGELRRRHSARPAEKTPRRLLFAMGDPIYPDENESTTELRPIMATRHGNLTRLTASGREVRTIAALAADDPDLDLGAGRSARLDSGAVAAFLGVHARETELQRPGFAERFRVIHLACHALADSEMPGLSGLFLTRPEKPQEGEDGYLSFREIFDLRLNADVVVLSACETNVGNVRGFEGIQGLARAFLFAGTPTVIVSNSKVSDHTTEMLMAAFYRAWWKAGLKPVEALRRAKLEVAKKHPHPFHWGGFVLWGTGE